MTETMTQPKHLTGPFVVGTKSHCTACGQPLTAVLLLGYPDAVLCCSGCGRRGVHCTCANPWAPKS